MHNNLLHDQKCFKWPAWATNLAHDRLRPLSFRVERQRREQSCVHAQGPAHNVAVGQELAQVNTLGNQRAAASNIPQPILLLTSHGVAVLVGCAVPFQKRGYLTEQVDEPGQGDNLQGLQNNWHWLALQHVNSAQPSIVVETQEHRGQPLADGIGVVSLLQSMRSQRDGHHLLAEPAGALGVHQSSEEGGQLGVALGRLGQPARCVQAENSTARIVTHSHQGQPSVSLRQPLPDHRGARGLQVLREERHGCLCDVLL
mmetsp:Transcript_1457/g.2954  ORF Transcript_1457/g.2954 Transcript_1457/m.2954 type:complete len:257 (+) Transcript_1457:79-849(+)